MINLTEQEQNFVRSNKEMLKQIFSKELDRIKTGILELRDKESIMDEVKFGKYMEEWLNYAEILERKNVPVGNKNSNFI